MIDDWLLSLIYAAWLAASTIPLGFMLGSSCSPCCGCGVADGKPRTDPKDEGTWVPSGTWRGVGGVTWSFTANPGDESGETWFFYGSTSTSNTGGGASIDQTRDWGNICNWYSNKTTSPSTTSGLPAAFDKRATRLPDSNSVVHIYRPVSTASVGPQTVKSIYFWGTGGFLPFVVSGSEITTTALAHDSAGGAVFNGSTFNNGIVNGGATFNGNSAMESGATLNGGATFNESSDNEDSTVNGGATFNDNSTNDNGIVNGGATFNDNSENIFSSIVNDGATFNDNSINGGGSVTPPSTATGTVNGGATFNGTSVNLDTVNDGATFYNSSRNGNGGIVNGGATFNDSSFNGGIGIVNGGATFNDSSFNTGFSTVNGGATFNDAACSERTTGDFFATPCTRKFVAHPTDLPTCNGTAPAGCDNAADTCGCN